MIKQNTSLNEMKAALSLWICDVDFWKDEVDDCQQLLDDNFFKINNRTQQKQVEQFQNQIIYYRDELLDKAKHDLLTQRQLLNENPEKYTELINAQEELEIRVSAIEDQMKERRTQLDQFVTSLQQ